MKNVHFQLFCILLAVSSFFITTRIFALSPFTFEFSNNKNIVNVPYQRDEPSVYELTLKATMIASGSAHIMKAEIEANETSKMINNIDINAIPGTDCARHMHKGQSCDITILITAKKANNSTQSPRIFKGVVHVVDSLGSRGIARFEVREIMQRQYAYVLSEKINPQFDPRTPSSLKITNAVSECEIDPNSGSVSTNCKDDTGVANTLNLNESAICRYSVEDAAKVEGKVVINSADRCYHSSQPYKLQGIWGIVAFAGKQLLQVLGEVFVTTAFRVTQCKIDNWSGRLSDCINQSIDMKSIIANASDAIKSMLPFMQKKGLGDNSKLAIGYKSVMISEIGDIHEQPASSGDKNKGFLLACEKNKQGLPNPKECAVTNQYKDSNNKTQSFNHPTGVNLINSVDANSTKEDFIVTQEEKKPGNSTPTPTDCKFTPHHGNQKPTLECRQIPVNAAKPKQVQLTSNLQQTPKKTYNGSLVYDEATKLLYQLAFNGTHFMVHEYSFNQDTRKLELEDSKDIIQTSDCTGEVLESITNPDATDEIKTGFSGQGSMITFEYWTTTKGQKEIKRAVLYIDFSRHTAVCDLLPVASNQKAAIVGIAAGKGGSINPLWWEDKLSIP